MLDVEQASTHFSDFFGSLSRSQLSHVPPLSLSLPFFLSFFLQVFLVTVVSLVIGTCPTQMAASRVTATPSVPSVHSVSQRGGSVSVKLVWEVGAVILAAEVHMV